MLTAVLSSGCGESVPEDPEVTNYIFKVVPHAFFGVNSKTGEQSKEDASSPKMDAAQCLTADDQKKQDAWVLTLINLIENKDAKITDAQRKEVAARARAFITNRAITAP